MSLDCIAIAGRRSTVIFFTVPISLFSQITVNDSGAVSSYGCSSGCTLSDPSRTVDGLQAARLLSQWSKQSLSLGLFSSLFTMDDSGISAYAGHREKPDGRQTRRLMRVPFLKEQTHSCPLSRQHSGTTV